MDNLEYIYEYIMIVFIIPMLTYIYSSNIFHEIDHHQSFDRQKSISDICPILFKDMQTPKNQEPKNPFQNVAHLSCKFGHF